MDRFKAVFTATRTYLREVLGELNKVVWPSRERTLKLTGVVVAMVAVIAGYLYLLDLPLGLAMAELFGH